LPTFIIVLVVLALFYQMFFRYETHESDNKTGIMVERDTLTGAEHVVKPGSQVSVIGHIFGTSGDTNRDGSLIKPWGDSSASGSDSVTSGNDHTTSGGDSATSRAASAQTNTGRIEPVSTPVDFNNHQQVEKIARPVPVPREVVIASSAPPVPTANRSEGSTFDDNSAKPFAIKQVDLNKDGATEEIIQNATQPDGLLDISIVKNGREIFFGRGKQISLLPSRSEGWSDIVLKMGAKTLQVFRYDPKEAAYRALDHRS
jgi:hypothetical protein